MADWNLPVLASLYQDFLALLKARDDDSITMGKAPITNPVVGTIRYERGTNTFQEWNGGAWVTLVVSLASGGLGASNPNDARNVLGIGTMGTQNANAVNITGGAISGMASISSNGPIYTGAHLHAITGIYAGNPPQLLTVPNGLIDSTKISGLIPAANLGSGTANSETFLRGDGTWASAMGYRASQQINTTVSLSAVVPANYDIPLTGFTNTSKMFFVHTSPLTKGTGPGTEDHMGHFSIPIPSVLRYTIDRFTGTAGRVHPISGTVLEII